MPAIVPIQTALANAIGILQNLLPRSSQLNNRQATQILNPGGTHMLAHMANMRNQPLAQPPPRAPPRPLNEHLVQVPFPWEYLRGQTQLTIEVRDNQLLMRFNRRGNRRNGRNDRNVRHSGQQQDRQ